MLQDNPGAGATSDTTGLLAALVREGAQRRLSGHPLGPGGTAATAHAAGVGGHVRCPHRRPLPGSRQRPLSRPACRSRPLSDGSFLCTGPMYGGAHAECWAPSPTLRILAMTEMRRACRRGVGPRTQNADQAMFRHIGIDPEAAGILAVKSSVHFMADYEPIASEVIFRRGAGCQSLPARPHPLPPSEARPAAWPARTPEFPGADRHFLESRRRNLAIAGRWCETCAP